MNTRLKAATDRMLQADINKDQGLTIAELDGIEAYRAMGAEWHAALDALKAELIECNLTHLAESPLEFISALRTIAREGAATS